MIELSLGTEEIRENKLNVIMQRFNQFEIISGEFIEQMETWFLKITIDLSILQKVIPQRGLKTKVLHALLKEWNVKTIQLRRSPNTTTKSLFWELKDLEFDLLLDKKEAANDQPTIALARNEVSSTSQSSKKTYMSRKDEVEDDMALLLKKFKKFIRHNKDGSLEDPIDLMKVRENLLKHQKIFLNAFVTIAGNQAILKLIVHTRQRKKRNMKIEGKKIKQKAQVWLQR